MKAPLSSPGLILGSVFKDTLSLVSIAMRLHESAGSSDENASLVAALQRSPWSRVTTGFPAALVVLLTADEGLFTFDLSKLEPSQRRKKPGPTLLSDWLL